MSCDAGSFPLSTAWKNKFVLGQLTDLLLGCLQAQFLAEVSNPHAAISS